MMVEAIGRRDTNLCTTDAAFKFLFKVLSEKKSILANKIRKCLNDRIEKSTTSRVIWRIELFTESSS